MVKLNLEVDEEVLSALEAIAADFDGSLGKAVGALVAAHHSDEELVDALEAGREDQLRAQLAQSEREFAEGKTVEWSELKARLGL